MPDSSGREATCCDHAESEHGAPPMGCRLCYCLNIPRPDAGRETTCRHCGEPIKQGDSGAWVHVRGPGSVLYRCDPDKSGKPYGLEATPSPPARETPHRRTNMRP